MDFSRLLWGCVSHDVKCKKNAEIFDAGGILWPGVAFRNCMKSWDHQLLGLSDASALSTVCSGFGV